MYLLLTLVFASAVGAADNQFAKVGDTIPDVSIRSIAGKETGIRSLVGEKPSVLIIYRGGWCPFCNRHLSALANIEKDLQPVGYQLLAISPDKPAKLKKTLTKGKLGYTLLSDSEMSLAKGLALRFGCRIRSLISTKVASASIWRLTQERNTICCPIRRCSWSINRARFSSHM